MVSYRTSPENTPERFIQVYHQQLVNFYRSLVNVDLVAKAGRGCEAYYSQMVDWMNQAGLFLDVSINTPLDENGNIAINKRFNFREDSEIMSVLNGIKKAKTPFASDEEDTAEEATVPASDESAQ